MAQQCDSLRGFFHRTEEAGVLRGALTCSQAARNVNFLFASNRKTLMIRGPVLDNSRDCLRPPHPALPITPAPQVKPPLPAQLCSAARKETATQTQTRRLHPPAPSQRPSAPPLHLRLRLAPTALRARHRRPQNSVLVSQGHARAHPALHRLATAPDDALDDSSAIGLPPRVGLAGVLGRALSHSAMDEKDPPPFGYTFTDDYLGASPSQQDSGGPSLLNEMETQELTDFFAQTPWSDLSAFPSAVGHKEATEAFDWPYGPPPATIHSVSTTIPDQAQLHGLNFHHPFISPHTDHFGSTADDLQAASTLFNHAQMAPPTTRAHSFHGVPSSSAPPNGQMSNGFTSLPMVPTANGLIHEQLASLLPNHHAEGSVDASIAAQWANGNIRQQHEAQLQELGLQRPQLKRPYTYGTDSAFHESGFQVSSKHETEDFVVGRLMHDMHHAQPLAMEPIGNGDMKPQSLAGDDERQSDDEDEDEEDEEDRPPKRRKNKAAPTRNGKATSGSRKSVSGGKNRKASVDDRVSKKKRGSVAGSKAQRENLTEEQKRNNHILSEQKRRNLIKRGFDDLHDLVPEIRNGGLSKSGILTEAANFLESLVADNKHYGELLGTTDG
ncbi:hypothetical protein K458DRAFT_384278 [Lentithecium fluviatile CBS 122367]|uniref:BHLH domain-containing protein n=1 Tax=Lentithecium fluviatile CBS 122367 TaxID=1168545 RepID=A0A6G1JGF4_9PLEO|nr:hypothetical protein K458DRAFT_384278 [Lentithecium fluviatile CBS 122367]